MKTPPNPQADRVWEIRLQGTQDKRTRVVRLNHSLSRTLASAIGLEVAGVGWQVRSTRLVNQLAKLAAFERNLDLSCRSA